MSEFRPPWRPQVDGSRYQWNNCGPTGHGMFAKRQRLGKAPLFNRKPWNSAIRKQGDGTGWISDLPTMASAIRKWLVDNENATGWGTTIPENLRAIKALWGVDKDVGYRFMVPWPDFAGYVVSGRGCAVRIIYRHLHGTNRDACRTFDGGHVVYVNERRFNAERGVYQFLVYDPLADHRFPWIPQGPQWWDASLLKKAATDNGAHGVEFSFTRDTDGA